MKKTIDLIEKVYDLKSARFDRGLNAKTVFKLHENEGFLKLNVEGDWCLKVALSACSLFESTKDLRCKPSMRYCFS